MNQSVNIHALFVNCGRGARELASPVRVGLPFKKDSEGPPFFYPQHYIAVWDTGAMGTSISRQLALDLNLPKIGEIEIQGVTGNELCNKYLISLLLPNNVFIVEIEVSDCSGNIGCDVLIGMDVIKLGDFAVTNKKGNTAFSFRIPSLELIDFTSPLGYGSSRDGSFQVPKIGRNELCPCGSGKKHKKCCGLLGIKNRELPRAVKPKK